MIAQRNDKLCSSLHLPRFVGQVLLGTIGMIAFANTSALTAATVHVVAGEGHTSTFDPPLVSIQPGDTVQWDFAPQTADHTVTSGDPATGYPDGLFDSGLKRTGTTFSFTFESPGTFPYFCVPHRTMGMYGVVIVGTPPPTPSPAQPMNISTRMEVLTDAQVLIGGFIITGNDPKEVVLRAIGPSLGAFGIADPLADPVLELHASDGSLITMNDNWKDTQQAEIETSGFQPQNDLESAIISTLDPGNYTAVVSGKDGGTGVGLVEGYDLDQAADSQFGNISTRGFVKTGTNVMIGGFILGGESGNANVVVRALGPSLTQFGVSWCVDRSDPGIAGWKRRPCPEQRQLEGHPADRDRSDRPAADE